MMQNRGYSHFSRSIFNIWLILARQGWHGDTQTSVLTMHRFCYKKKCTLQSLDFTIWGFLILRVKHAFVEDSHIKEMILNNKNTIKTSSQQVGACSPSRCSAPLTGVHSKQKNTHTSSKRLLSLSRCSITSWWYYVHERYIKHIYI